LRSLDLDGALIDSENAITELNDGNLDEAVNTFSEAVTLNPELAVGWYNTVKIEKKLGYVEIGRQQNLTKAYFERAVLVTAPFKF